MHFEIIGEIENIETILKLWLKKMPASKVVTVKKVL